MITKQKELKKNVDDMNQETSTAQVDDVDEHQRMIAKAAYYRAENKGFVAGQEIEDWLEAEKEIESSIGKS